MHIPATALFKLTIEMSVLLITFRKLKAEVNIYSWLWRLSTASGLETRFSKVGPSKVQACKSFMITANVKK